MTAFSSALPLIREREYSHKRPTNKRILKQTLPQNPSDTANGRPANQMKCSISSLPYALLGYRRLARSEHKGKNSECAFSRNSLNRATIERRPAERDAQKRSIEARSEKARYSPPIYSPLCAQASGNAYSSALFSGSITQALLPNSFEIYKA